MEFKTMTETDLIEKELFSIPIPAKTRTYSPVSHREIVSNIKEAARLHNLEVVKKQYIHNRDMRQLSGKFTLSHCDSEMGTMVAFQNSYDKKLTMKFAIGATVFVCGNGMVVGEQTFSRKHVGVNPQELLEFIFETIAQSGNQFQNTIRERELMKQVMFGNDELTYMIGDLFLKQNVIKRNQLSAFEKEYRKPTITPAEYNTVKNSAWHIYNVFTYAIEKNSHPKDYLNQHNSLHKYFKNLLRNKGYETYN